MSTDPQPTPLDAARVAFAGEFPFSIYDEEPLVAAGTLLRRLIAYAERVEARADAAEAERDEFKRLFSECHPVHLDGVKRARAAEATLAAVRVQAERMKAGRVRPYRRRVDRRSVNEAMVQAGQHAVGGIDGQYVSDTAMRAALEAALGKGSAT